MNEVVKRSNQAVKLLFADVAALQARLAEPQISAELVLSELQSSTLSPLLSEVLVSDDARAEDLNFGLVSYRQCLHPKGQDAFTRQVTG